MQGAINRRLRQDALPSRIQDRLALARGTGRRRAAHQVGTRCDRFTIALDPVWRCHGIGIGGHKNAVRPHHAEGIEPLSTGDFTQCGFKLQRRQKSRSA